MKIIDCHFHWFPSSYCEKLLGRTVAPRSEKLADGYRYIAARGSSDCVIGDVWMNLDRQFKDMDATGHELTVISSSSTLCGDIADLPAGLAVEVAVSFNEQMAEGHRRYPERFWGTAVLPFQDVERSLQLLEEAIGGLGLVGVNLPTSVGDLQIDAAQFETLYARIEELGVPLLIHAGDNVFGPMLLGEYQGALHYSAGRLFESSMAALRLVVSGILERHPRLKVLHFHAGGVLPYMSGRLDKNARRPNLQAPSTYLRRMHTDTVAPHVHTLRLALEFYGVDHVMYGTDYPCWSPAAAFAAFEELGLEQGDVGKILRGNAARFFNIA